MAKDIIPFERKEGAISPGAVYSIAYFYDEDGYPCNKEDAVRINIVEYDKNDERINETYGLVMKDRIC